MKTNRELALQMVDVLREFIEKTGQDKYLHLDNPEPHDIIIGAGLAEGYFWGEMYKRLHEIAVKLKSKQPFAEDLLKILHEGLCLLALKHSELLKDEKENKQRKETINEAFHAVQNAAEKFGYNKFLDNH